MKVILTKDVADLGRAGDVINAAEGYARNFLIPRNMAIPADRGSLAALDKKRKVLEMKGEKLAEEAKAIAERLHDARVTIAGKAGSGTRLYGSVTNQEIADAVASQLKVNLDKRKIHIIDPIKNIGSFEVPVKLHHDVTASIHVDVVAAE